MRYSCFYTSKLHSIPPVIALACGMDIVQLGNWVKQDGCRLSELCDGMRTGSHEGMCHYSIIYHTSHVTMKISCASAAVHSACVAPQS